MGSSRPIVIDITTGKQVGMSVPKSCSQSQWRCKNGHITITSLFFLISGSKVSAHGGSSWDFCDNCEDSPTPEQREKMAKEIYAMVSKASGLDMEMQADE